MRYNTKRPVLLLLHTALVLLVAGGLVTHFSGRRGSVHLREGVPVSAIELKDGSLADLPFQLELKEFRIEYDPGTRNVADYVSTVVFLPGSSFAGLTGETPVTISMNHIAKRDGYRFYQADFDEDGRGSILAVSHDPWGVGIVYTAFLLLLVSMVGYFFERDNAWYRTLRPMHRRPESRPRRRLWPLVLTVAGAALFAAWLVRVYPKGALLPVLRTPLLVIHVVPIILSYTLFALTAILGIIGLLLPADKSERLQRVNRLLLLPAVFLLTFGTCLGAVWANISWGNYWSWDPKETWALITILVYALPLHAELLPVFRRTRFFHAFCILAFLAVLVTYFGVNLFLGGVHSYA